jgi:hypothetical protein
LFEIIDFHLPSLGAIVIEFSRLPTMFDHIRKFDRAAIKNTVTGLSLTPAAATRKWCGARERRSGRPGYASSVSLSFHFPRGVLSVR